MTPQEKNWFDQALVALNEGWSCLDQMLGDDDDDPQIERLVEQAADLIDEVRRVMKELSP